MTQAKRFKSKPTKSSHGPTWFSIVAEIVVRHCPVPLRQIYAEARRHPKARGKRHVEAKIRQVLYLHEHVFVEVGPGVWDLTSNRSPEELQSLRIEREQRLSGRRKSER